MSVDLSRSALAQALWIVARRRAEEAQEEFRIADNIACERFADYVELTQPGFAKFFRRVLKIQQSRESDK